MRVLKDPVECRKVTDLYPDYFTFDADTWFNHPDNIALQEGENIAFGEAKGGGYYWVHFCFHTAKGRGAIDLTRRMVARFFSLAPVSVAVGPILLDNKKARWLIRQVGFKSLGEEDTLTGRCEMFYFTKDDLNGLF